MHVSAIDADRIAELLHILLRDFLHAGELLQALVRPPFPSVAGDGVADVFAQDRVDFYSYVALGGLVDVELGRLGYLVLFSHGRARCGSDKKAGDENNSGEV